MKGLRDWICGRPKEDPQPDPEIEKVLDVVLGPLDPNLHDQKLFDRA